MIHASYISRHLNVATFPRVYQYNQKPILVQCYQFKDNSVTIHVRNLGILATELYETREMLLR